MRRRDIPTIYLRERALRNLFIANASPAEAADRAATELTTRGHRSAGRPADEKADHWRIATVFQVELDVAQAAELYDAGLKVAARSQQRP